MPFTFCDVAPLRLALDALHEKESRCWVNLVIRTLLQNLQENILKPLYP